MAQVPDYEKKLRDQAEVLKAYDNGTVSHLTTANRFKTAAENHGRGLHGANEYPWCPVCARERKKVT